VGDASLPGAHPRWGAPGGRAGAPAAAAAAADLAQARPHARPGEGAATARKPATGLKPIVIASARSPGTQPLVRQQQAGAWAGVGKGGRDGAALHMRKRCAARWTRAAPGTWPRARPHHLASLLQPVTQIRGGAAHGKPAAGHRGRGRRRAAPGRHLDGVVAASGRKAPLGLPGPLGRDERAGRRGRRPRHRHRAHRVRVLDLPQRARVRPVSAPRCAGRKAPRRMARAIRGAGSASAQPRARRARGGACMQRATPVGS